MNILGFNINRSKSPVSASDTKKGKSNPKAVKIVQGFEDQSRKDIDKWRTALTMASDIDDPTLTPYYDLISDLMTDGHLQSQIQLRKASTLNANFHIYNKKTGETNIELTSLLNQQWFYQFLDFALESILFGTSIIEFQKLDADDIDIVLIPRRHTVPSKNRIILNLEDADTYIDYSDPAYANWILKLGDATSLGIINNIIPNIIWKRNVMQAWAEFCEKFGIPLITATCNTSDKKVIDAVHNILLDIGQSNVGAFPVGTAIAFQEPNRTDAYNTYKEFLASNTDVISKQLVGSTMLSDQGTNRSQTEVHERGLDDKIALADKRMISFAVNKQLLVLLKNHGYAISDDDAFEFKPIDEKIEIGQLWNITNSMLDKGYDIDTKWLAKTFKIPVEGSKKKVMINATAQMNTIPSIERYPSSCDCDEGIIASSPRLNKKLNKLTEELIKGLHASDELDGLIGSFVAEEANIIVEGLRQNFQTISPYTGPDILALQLMEYNVFDFVESKVEARLAAMKNLLVDEQKQIRNFSDFRELATKEVSQFSNNWLRAEYNLAVAVGQTSAQYYRFSAEKEKVTSFVKYQSARDSKVRTAHQVLEGMIFNLSDAQAMNLWAPNGYGCRCELVQHLLQPHEKVTKGTDAMATLHVADDKFEKSQFNINRANLKKVFTDKQFYSNNKGLPERINSRTYDKYNLESYDKIKAKAPALKLNTTISKANLKKLFKKEKGTNYMGFEDYLGRKMVITEDSFDTHTQGKYLTPEQNRHQLFPHIKDVLSNPDEVWLSKLDQNSFYTKKYVKFYKNQTLVVRTDIQKDTESLNIQTWYPLKGDEKLTRNGVKIR